MKKLLITLLLICGFALTALAEEKLVEGNLDATTMKDVQVWLARGEYNLNFEAPSQGWVILMSYTGYG